MTSCSLPDLFRPWWKQFQLEDFQNPGSSPWALGVSQAGCRNFGAAGMSCNRRAAPAAEAATAVVASDLLLGRSHFCPTGSLRGGDSFASRCRNRSLLIRRARPPLSALHVDFPKSSQRGAYPAQLIFQARTFLLQMLHHGLHQCFGHRWILSPVDQMARLFVYNDYLIFAQFPFQLSSRSGRALWRRRGPAVNRNFVSLIYHSVLESRAPSPCSCSASLT